MAQMQNILVSEHIRGVNANYIFVIMSFKPEYDEIYTAYRTAALLNGNKRVKVQRVDDDYGGFLITEKIEANIERAGLILCDISEASPNVFYEFGYARAKGKSIVITAKKGTDLPFDVRNYRTILCTSPIDLQSKVLVELKSHYNVKNQNETV